MKEVKQIKEALGVFKENLRELAKLEKEVNGTDTEETINEVWENIARRIWNENSETVLRIDSLSSLPSSEWRLRLRK